MAHAEDLRSWAAREMLPLFVIQVLQDQGFNSVDQIRKSLSPDDVMPMFLDTQMLSMAHCFALQSAINNLSRSPGSAAPADQSSPVSAQRRSKSYAPAYNALPQPAPTSHPYPTARQTHLSSHPPGYYAPPQPVPTSHPYPTARQTHLSTHSPVYNAPSAADMGGISSALGATGIYGEEEYRLLLVGKVGSGKSTSGNTILGEKRFRTGLQFNAVTGACERNIGRRLGRKFQIMDCPGLYDPQRTNEEIGIAIVQAVAGMHPGPSAILYVISLGRYTEEEFGTYQRVKGLFDEAITRHMIVLFTGGDRLEQENTSIEQLVDQNPTKELKQVLRECNDRYVVFNNMARDKEPQVARLFSMVSRTMAENNHQPYTCPKFSAIGQGLEKEVARRMEKVEKEDLKRKAYVMKLEQQAKEADQVARETIKRSEENEQRRQRKMKEEEKKNQKIRDELQAQQEEQLKRKRKHEEELQRLLKEREDQERRMKEKEHEMTERERQKAAEEVERMRQRELDMQQRLAEERQRIAARQQEDEDRRREMEQQTQQFKQAMEAQRRKEAEEVQAAAAQREKALNDKLEEERAHREKMEQVHRQEMEDIKRQIAEGNKTSIWSTIGKGAIPLACAAVGAFFGNVAGATAGVAIGHGVANAMFSG